MAGQYADGITGWLNREAPADYGRNVQASRSKVLELRDAIETVRNFISQRKHEDATGEFGKAERTIKDAVVSYPPVGEVEIRAASGNAKWRYRKAGTPGIPYGETLAIWRLLELAKTREFHLLRQCVDGDCGRWFFAKREDKLGCCSEHQRKAYEKTEKFKEYRRGYMREYYALKSSGKVK